MRAPQLKFGRITAHSEPIHPTVLGRNCRGAASQAAGLRPRSGLVPLGLGTGHDGGPLSAKAVYRPEWSYRSTPRTGRPERSGRRVPLAGKVAHYRNVL